MKEVEKGERIKIEDIPVLLRECVHIRDKANVEDVINRLVEGGPEKLQVISDFDQTMTKQHMNGERCLSSFGVFGHCPQLPVNYKEKSQALFNEYRPIEIDPDMSIEQKIPHMVDWYKKAEDLLRGYEFPRSQLEEALEHVTLELRSGTNSLLGRLNAANVPVLVFSAGLGDMVSAILQHNDSLLPNVHIISNFLQYEGDMLRGFKGQIIHTFNKNEHALENSDYFKLLEGRSNVILLGDSEGDVRMAEGVKDASSVLKIGFLYDRAQENLELYERLYDIVLVDDQTMDVPSALLSIIL